MKKSFSISMIIGRRIGLALLGFIAFPVVALLGLRAPFYSFIHREWIKRNDTPSWLQQSERLNNMLLY